MLNKRIITVFLVILCFSFNTTFAYPKLSEGDHKFIDTLLNRFHSASKEVKKEKSEIYSNVATDAKILRNAYLGVYTGDKLTGTILNKASIEKGIRQYNTLTESKKNSTIETLKEVQYLAEELQRSFQIESEETFQGYASTILPTPLYWLNKNAVDINKIMGGKGTTGLELDSANTIDQLSIVLPVGTPVTLIDKVEKGEFTYYEVRTRDFDVGYGNKDAYFLDSRFIEKKETKPDEVIHKLPDMASIFKTLLAAVDSQYIWGGSYYQGIPEINDFYPTPEAVELSTGEKQYKILQGTDCSGLLWQATNGYTPRTTRTLLTFGDAVVVSGNSVDQIISKVKPLDLIVWAGHVIIILSNEYAIESIWKANFEGGVEIVSLKERLEDIFTRRVPVNDWNKSSLSEKQKFVIRRWFK